MEVSIGLDVGTSGVRAAAMSLSGEMVASAQVDFPPGTTQTTDTFVEQNPRVWEQAVVGALRRLSHALSTLETAPAVVGLAVDATSGTFLFLNSVREPITPGIMYSDLRAAEYAEEAQTALSEALQPYGITIGPAFALCKILHFLHKEPALFEKTHYIVHQTDYVVGLLSGCFEVTDISSGLKTGANPGTLVWPEELESRLGLPLSLLPDIVPSGEVIGHLTRDAAEKTGLPEGLPIVSGCTDGTAGAIASGISQPGEVNVTLGTTLVFKAVSESPLHDPLGRVYNHRHPGGGFLPGAASSTGAEWVRREFPDADLTQLEEVAASLVPSGVIAYPLCRTGERFPFSNPEATGFGLREVSDPPARFVAGMEGVACLEKLGLQTLEDIGLPTSKAIHATGGGTHNNLWLRIRASVTGRTLLLPEYPDCVVGAAVLAATPHLGSFQQAQAQMVRIHRRIEPEHDLQRAYGEQYERFCDRLRSQGYLS